MKIFKHKLIVLFSILAFAMLIPGLEAGEGQIDISSLPFVISSPGSYILVRDVVYPASETADPISIDSANVSIDLGGHTLNGENNNNDLNGIISIASGNDNITIKNGRLLNWGNTGVNLANSKYCHIENIQSTGNYLLQNSAYGNSTDFDIDSGNTEGSGDLANVSY